VIVERLHAYEAETEPLLEYYKRTGLLHVVSAESNPETVQARIIGVLDSKQA
jgi:adenylate kinase family enzyme